MTEKLRKFANEYVVSLFPVFMLPIGMHSGTKRMLGWPVKVSFIIENNSIQWLFQPKNWKEGHARLVRKIQDNPDFLRQSFHEMANLARRQIDFGKKHRNQYPKVSNAKLFQYYSQFIRYNTELYEYGLILPLLDYQETTFLSDELRKILKRKKQDRNFNLLTIPFQQTFVKQQELDLLRLLRIRDKNLLARRIKQHTTKYAWIYYVYEGPAVNEKYFIEALEDLRKRKINPGKELAEQEKNSALVKLRQHKILSKIDLTKYERQIIDLARDSVFYKASRRELQSFSYYLIEPLFNEIGRRLNLSLKQVRMMLPHEIKAALTNKKVNLNEIQNRQKLLFYDYNKNMICLSGKAASNFISRNVVKEKIDLNVKVFKGTTAYPGKVKGSVKIINSPADMTKMQKGDILVAVTTSPNLMPAIRVAKAIATEEGGLTCHAAIVARELHIPTVVGAGAVAHALKDNDLVEVDANKGIVRKI